MVFVLQARPVKMWFKIAFYMMAKPPAIIATLLPSPEQAILSADLEKSYTILYNPDEEQKKTATNTAKGRVLGNSVKEETETSKDEDMGSVKSDDDIDEESDEEESDDEEEDEEEGEEEE